MIKQNIVKLKEENKMIIAKYEGKGKQGHLQILVVNKESVLEICVAQHL